MPASSQRSPRNGAPAGTSERKLRDARDVLDAAGLRPIVDAKLCRVVADCPRCDVGASDPLQIHRPLSVGCWTTQSEDPVRLKCWSGCDPEAVRAAIVAPEPDWKALAEDTLRTAEDAVTALEAALAASHAEPELVPA